MKNIDLNLNNIIDQHVQENFQKLQDFLNAMQTTQNQLQACEIHVVSNISGGTINHSLGGVPLDIVVTRLIAPSAARLKFRFADFTKDTVVYDVTGLADGQVLSARFLAGSFPDVVATGDVVRADSEVMEVRSKF